MKVAMKTAVTSVLRPALLRNAAFFLVALLATGLWPLELSAMSLSLDQNAGADVVTLAFDAALPPHQVVRTGPRELTVTFGPGFWSGRRGPQSGELQAGLLRGVERTETGLRFTLSSNEFGFISTAAQEPPSLRLMVFSDPLGARWSPPEDATQPAQPAGQQPPPEDRQGAEPPEQAQTRQAVAPPPERQAVQPPSPTRRAVDQAVNDSAAQQRRGEAVGRAVDAAVGKLRRSFYAAPYTLRGEVKRVGPYEAEPMSTMGEPVPPPLAGNASQAPANETRNASRPPAPEAGPEDIAADQIESEVTLEMQKAGEEMVQRQAPASTPPAPAAPQTGGQAAQPEPDEVVEPVTPPGEAPESAVSVQAQGDTARGKVQPPPSRAKPPAPSPSRVDKETVEPANASTQIAKAQTAGQAVNETEAVAEPEPASEPEDPILEDYKLKILTAQREISDGKARQARNSLESMLTAPDFPEELRVDALYSLADAYMQIYRDDLENHLETVIGAYDRAMNADLESPQVPRALLSMGLAHLKAGNIPEAKAYFNILRKEYPHDTNIPHISYYWGDYYFEQGDFEKAADNFQYLVQNYPDSPLVRDAALGLARSLIELEYYDQAFQIVDYIEKRWPRFYVDFPPFLKLSGNVAYQLGKLDKAKSDYWTFYNIDPTQTGNDVVLARLGDIYLRSGDKKAAKEMYMNVAEQYPDEEGGLVAKMRLAEEGIYDDPTMDQMVNVFDRSFSLKPEKIYTTIVRKFPKSPLAPLAQLKLAMWYYFNKKYADSLRAAQDFLGRYPRSELLPKARQLGFKVFNLAVPELIEDENYGRVITYWEDYGDLLKEQGGVDEEVRMAVALSYWKKGAPRKALEIIQHYLAEKKKGKYSEMALDMALSIYLETSEWSEIVELASRVRENWELPVEQQRQVDYALAVAYENLGDMDKSEPLWSRLAADTDLDPATRAYAMYYMAKAAMQDRDLRKVFIYSQEALTMFLESAGDREKIKDCILMTIYAAEESGRYREALKWAEQYDKYVPESDPEWAGSRFRLARLYQKAGAQEKWEQIMQEIKKKQPEGIYGKMAAQALDAESLEQEARSYGRP